MDDDRRGDWIFLIFLLLWAVFFLIGFTWVAKSDFDRQMDLFERRIERTTR